MKVLCAVCNRETDVPEEEVSLCGYHLEVFRQSYDDWDTFIKKTKETLMIPMFRMFEYRSLSDLNRSFMNFAKEGVLIKRVEVVQLNGSPRYFVLTDGNPALLKGMLDRDRERRGGENDRD